MTTHSSKSSRGSDKPIQISDISPQGQVRLLDLSYARIAYGYCLIPIVGISLIAWLYHIDGNVHGFVVWTIAFALAAVVVQVAFRRYKEDCSRLTEEQVMRKWRPRVHALALIYGCGLSTPFVLMATGEFLAEFAMMYLVICAAIVAGNATHQSPILSAFQRFFATSWGVTTCLIPWVFPRQWPYLLPLTIFYNVSIYKHAAQVHRFFLQHIGLEEEGIRLAESYRAAKEAAEEALRSKNQFLTTASHDLRQPVHAMGFLIESIARRNKDEALTPALMDLKQSVRSVTQMFNSLLDLSKIELGAVQVRIESASLSELMNDVATVFREEAQSRGLDLRVRSNAKAVVRADVMLLRQSMINLMQNALRYTQRGGVLMAARRRGHDWQFEVWDTGMGVATQDQSRIFSPFFRNEHAWRIDNAGHGLGLAVVARCAALMGATHGLSSRMGRGSRFWLRMPAAALGDVGQGDTSPTEMEAHEASDYFLSGTCLIVDDDPQVCAAWESLLASWGLQVRCATSATEAFSTIAGGFRPHAIFCDQRLRAGESGFDLLRELLDRCPEATGAMISGEFDSPELRQAENEGYLVLHKPLEPEQLFAVLSHWLTMPFSGDGETHR